MKASQLFVRCLEQENVEYIFGIPGEENIAVMDALLDSSISFITTRHEQGAAFMADVYGRLTGRAGVCLATLGPGATNLITGVADANMDYAPLVALSGQGATTRMHKESHQVLDLVNMFEPVTKYSTEVREPEVIPEIVRKAFKVAQSEKPGASFISLPENIAGMGVEAKCPLKVQAPSVPHPSIEKLEQAATIINRASCPVILAGNGVIRSKASKALVRFAEESLIPVATTFMAKGSMPFSHPLSLGTVGLQASDYVSCGFDRADVVICVGYDMIEYHPHLWHKHKDKKIIHLDSIAAEVDEHYVLETGVIGNIAIALQQLSEMVLPKNRQPLGELRQVIKDELSKHSSDTGFPVKPQRILADVRRALGDDDIVISDVGAHKMWVARMFQAEAPNSCIISNGFASMGIAVPGAIAAKLACPEKRVLAITGDAGFMMNSQEIETALRLGLPLVVLIWTDSEYGLIKWHQLRHFGRPSHIEFSNPDFVKYAESFGAKGFRVASAEQLLPTLEAAFEQNTVCLVDCPVDYAENMKLTEKLGELSCPV